MKRGFFVSICVCVCAREGGDVCRGESGLDQTITRVYAACGRTSPVCRGGVGVEVMQGVAVYVGRAYE